MVGARRLGSEQSEHQIHRLIVDRIELDRLGQPGKYPMNAIDAGEFAVRNGDAVAEAGGTELLPPEQGLEHHPGLELGEAGGKDRKLLQQLLLVGCLEIGDHAFHTKDFVQLHGIIPPGPVRSSLYGHHDGDRPD